MFKHGPKRIAFRGFMVVACLALIGGCKAEVSPAPEGAKPDTPVEAPLAPTSLVATPGNAQAFLSWSASSGAASYDVKRSATSGGPYAPLATAMSPSYTDATVSNGATYYYVVAAVNSTGVSSISAQASVTPIASTNPATTPTVPMGLSATAGNARVNLTWSASSGAISYNLKRAATSGGPYTRVATTSSTSNSDISLTNGTTYYYVVSALNSVGESANSTQVSAVPAAPATVGGCSNLSAPGVWENITPQGNYTARPAVNGTVTAAIVVDPFDPRKLWLGTGGENTDIWRSDNCGSTWTKVNTGPGSQVGTGAQWSMQADPVNPGVLYTVSGYGAQGLWKSTDGGNSWKDILAGSEYERVAEFRFANQVTMDPTNHLHLAVSTHGGCAAPYTPSCIAETSDGGATWKVVAAPENWSEGGGLIIVKGGHWLWCGTQVMVTKDGGATWNRNALVGGGPCEAQYTIRSFVPSANGKYYVGSRYGVLRSANGENWEKVPGTDYLWVAFAQGSKKLFAANQWGQPIKWASIDNDQVWNDLPVPPQVTQVGNPGVPFLAYDDVHGILYASMFTGGLARMVIPQ